MDAGPLALTLGSKLSTPWLTYDKGTAQGPRSHMIKRPSGLQGVCGVSGETESETESVPVRQLETSLAIKTDDILKVLVVY